MEANNKHQIVRIEIVRDFDSTYYANLYDSKGCSHNLSKEYTDYRTMKSLCKREYGVSLPNLADVEFERHGRKSYAYINTETPRISTETAEVESVSGENEKHKGSAKYRFTQNEIEEMKQQILGECEFNFTALNKGYKKVFPEMGEYRAANIRRNYEGYINEFKEGSKNRKFYERQLALYESLTDKDRPNFTDDKKGENVSDEGEKAAETRQNTLERKIEYFHYTPEQLKRYIIDVYQKNTNGEWVLQPHEQIDTDTCLWDVVDGKIGWWTNWRREKFSEMNMDFNSPTCGRCCKINRTYQKDDFIVSNEKLMEFTVNGEYYYIQKQTYNKGKHRWSYTIMDALGDFAVNDFSYTLKGIMRRFNKMWKKNAAIIWRCRAA